VKVCSTRKNLGKHGARFKLKPQSCDRLSKGGGDTATKRWTRMFRPRRICGGLFCRGTFVATNSPRSSALFWGALSAGMTRANFMHIAQPVCAQLQAATSPAGNPRPNSSRVGHANAAETADSLMKTRIYGVRAPMQGRAVTNCGD